MAPRKKSSRQERLDRFERTNVEATALIDEERKALDEKTAKLKKARLAAEAKTNRQKPAST